MTIGTFYETIKRIVQRDFAPAGFYHSFESLSYFGISQHGIGVYEGILSAGSTVVSGPNAATTRPYQFKTSATLTHFDATADTACKNHRLATDFTATRNVHFFDRAHNFHLIRERTDALVATTVLLATSSATGRPIAVYLPVI
jgi:hypothetical protein